MIRAETAGKLSYKNSKRISEAQKKKDQEENAFLEKKAKTLVPKYKKEIEKIIKKSIKNGSFTASYDKSNSPIDRMAQKIALSNLFRDGYTIKNEEPYRDNDGNITNEFWEITWSR